MWLCNCSGGQFKGPYEKPLSLSLDQLKLRQELELLCRSKKGTFQVSCDQECSWLKSLPKLEIGCCCFYDILIGPDIWSKCFYIQSNSENFVEQLSPRWIIERHGKCLLNILWLNMTSSKNLVGCNTESRHWWCP